MLTYTIRYKLSMVLALFFYTPITLRLLLAASADHFWWPEKFENMANPDFENIKHLQNLDFSWIQLVCIS